MKNRSRIEICYQLLQTIEKYSATSEGCNQAKLMYGGYLSFSQVKDYVDTLINNGLIQSIPVSGLSKYTYKITQKGWEYMKKIEEMNELCSFIKKSE